jgi:hypothetical protein
MYKTRCTKCFKFECTHLFNRSRKRASERACECVCVCVYVCYIILFYCMGILEYTLVQHRK